MFQPKSCESFNKFFSMFKSFKKSINKEIHRNHNKDPEQHEFYLRTIVKNGYIEGMRLLCDEDYIIDEKHLDKSFIFLLTLYLVIFDESLIELEKNNFPMIEKTASRLKERLFCSEKNKLISTIDDCSFYKKTTIDCRKLIRSDFSEKSTEWFKAFLYYKLASDSLLIFVKYHSLIPEIQRQVVRDLRLTLNEIIKAEIMTLNHEFDFEDFKN